MLGCVHAGSISRNPARFSVNSRNMSGARKKRTTASNRASSAHSRKPKAPLSRAGGRYSHALAARICDNIAGGMSLRKACEAEGIAFQAVQQWVKKSDKFACQYAQAREFRTQLQGEDFMDLVMNREIPPEDRRIMVDGCKWHLSKMLPKVYGDKVGVEHSGNAGVSVTIIRRPE